MYYSGVVLHQDNKGQTPPSGYVDISGPKEFFCARSFGDCGAKAPIYRYKNRNQLINSKDKDVCILIETKVPKLKLKFTLFSFSHFKYLFVIPVGYAYSFRANELIDGYVRELHPICYGWKDSSSDSDNSNDNKITGTKDPTDCTPIRNVSNGQVTVIFEFLYDDTVFYYVLLSIFQVPFYSFFKEFIIPQNVFNKYL